ncbi:MAG: hypothetical protein PVF83_00250 [Anaerolineales bacterium]|jgi:hypothetical protein
MSYFTLYILMVFLAALVFVVYRAVQAPIRKGEKKLQDFAEYKKRQSQAVWAGATVVTINKPKMNHYGRRQLKVDLRLEVESPAGEKYQVRTAWLVDVDVLSQIQPGASVSIKIDAEDPQIIFPNMRGVEYWIGD